MPIEGISMTTVFSLVTVGLALSISAFIGGYFLQPSFDIAAVMAGVAYDIATMYDLAYTLPGKVTVNYYGPSACLWNYNQPSDEAASFHCFSGDAVVIKEVLINAQRLYVLKDPYMNYDYENNNDDGLSLPAEGVGFPRPAFLSVEIPYYNAQICPFSTDTFSYCDLAYAPFAASYVDIDILALTPASVKVEDWAFKVSKDNVGDYYETIKDNPGVPSSLVTFLSFLVGTYDKLCEPETGEDYFKDFSFNPPSETVMPYSSDIPVDEDAVLNYNLNDLGGGYFLQLLKGYRWRIYDSAMFSDLSNSWSFDESKGSIITDKTGGEDGLMVNNPLFSADSVNGYSLIFDGVDDYVRFGNTVGNFAGNDFSISFWMKSESISPSQVIVSKGNFADTGKWGVRKNGAENTLNFIASNTITTSNAEVFGTGWHHIIITRDNLGANGEVCIYVDGEEDACSTQTAYGGDLTINNLVSLEMGARNHNEYYNGLIDEFNIYTKVLSSDEINSLYSTPYNNLICQERIVVNDKFNWEINGTSLEGGVNFYVTDYCFDISNILLRNKCDNDYIKNIKLDADFINLVNEEYTYYASQSSCLKPYLAVEGNDLVIKGVDVWFNFLADEGRCQHR